MAFRKRGQFTGLALGLALIALVAAGRAPADEPPATGFGDALRRMQDRTPANIPNVGGDLLGNNKLPPTLAELNESLEKNPADKSALYKRAVANEDAGRLAEALDDANRLVALDAGSVAYYDLRGDIRNKLGDSTGAIADYGESIRLDPVYHYAYRERGKIYLDSGRLTAAMADFNRAIQFKPDDLECHVMRCGAHLDLWQLDAALADADWLVAKLPHSAQMLEIRGKVYRKLLSYDESLKDHEAAQHAMPNYAEPYATAGYVLFEMGRHDEAIDRLNRAIELAPDDASALRARALTHSTLGDWERATADLSEVLRIQPDDDWALLQRAALYSLCGKDELAQADCQAVATHNKNLSIGRWEPGLFAKTADTPNDVAGFEPAADNVLAEFIVPGLRDDLTIPVRISGQTLRFVVDTGSDLTTLDRAHADLLGPQRRSVEISTVEGSVRTALFGSQPISLGDLKVTPAGEIGCCDLAQISKAGASSHIDGVLGMDVLGQLVVRVDLQRRKLWFLRSCDDLGGEEIRFVGSPGREPDGDSKRSRCPDIMLKLPDGSVARATIDTGMTPASLALRAEAYNRFVADGSLRPVRASLADTLSATVLVPSALASRVGIGGLEHRNLLVDRAPNNNAIGLNLLARYVVTFDFPRRRMLLRSTAVSGVSEAELALRLDRSWSRRIVDYTTAQALQAFDRQIHANPQQALAYHSRAMFLFEKQKYQEAIADLTVAIDLEPTNARLLYERGVTYLWMKQLPAAIADFSRVIAREPDMVEAFHYRGVAYYGRRDFARSLTDFQAAMRLRPESKLARKSFDYALAAWRKQQASLVKDCSSPRHRRLLARWRARRWARICR